MTSEESAKDFYRMYESLTNPEKRAEARRKVEREKRLKDKIEDTGV